MADHGDWSCDANDAVQLSIVRPGDQKPVTTDLFHPQFTYSIFGDDEQIFGYKGLIIRLRFAAHDLRTHVHISFDEKFKPVGDAAATDLNKTLKDWVPDFAFTRLPDYEKAVQNDENAKGFFPPGNLLCQYTSKENRFYEIWAGSLADTAVRNLLARAQIFVPFFIEAGTPLILDDPEWTLERWTVYFVYEKITPPTPSASEYSFVGYATTYRWWFYSEQKGEKGVVKNDTFPYPEELRFSTLPSRLRISQFLILPPHQGSGHGSQLYNTIHKAAIEDDTVVELTVEDPNEAFDVLRDSGDYHTLYPEFMKQDININPDPFSAEAGKRRPRRVPTAALIPTEKLNKIRSQYKIAPTQFAHILEMFLLKRIPHPKRAAGGANMARLLTKKHKADDENERRYYWWRMLLKQRLYKRSRDILIQLDLPERIQKLDETASNVEEGYEALLTVFDAREKGKATAAAPASSADQAEAATPVRLKRKYAVEDDEDQEEEEEEDQPERAEAAKRPKVQ